MRSKKQDVKLRKLIKLVKNNSFIDYDELSIEFGMKKQSIINKVYRIKRGDYD